MTNACAAATEAEPDDPVPLAFRSTQMHGSEIANGGSDHFRIEGEADLHDLLHDAVQWSRRVRFLPETENSVRVAMDDVTPLSFEIPYDHRHTCPKRVQRCLIRIG